MTRFGGWARRLMDLSAAGEPTRAHRNSLLADLRAVPGSESSPRLKVLLVVAHPDDESECAAFLYHVTHELGGVVDQVVVTNGEAGTQYRRTRAGLLRRRVGCRA